MKRSGSVKESDKHKLSMYAIRKSDKVIVVKKQVNKVIVMRTNYELLVPFSIKIKSFFDFNVLTPFEEKLLILLKEKLDATDQVALDKQLNYFNKVSRFLEPSEKINSYGYTEFHKVKFGRPVLEFPSDMTLSESLKDGQLATASVKFEGGEINVEFRILKGVLVIIKYRSPQKIYYPPENYTVATVIQDIYGRPPNVN